MNLKSFLFNFLIALLVFYILFGVLFFFFQKSLIYYPPVQNFESCSGFEDYQKIDYHGTRFYYKNNSLENVLVYYHGNAESACDISYLKSNFEQANLSLIFVEYTGYSDNMNPSKKLILEDVKKINNFVKENSYKNIIVYGQSVGSGAASYHAFIGNVSSLILVTPFFKFSDLVYSKVLFYPVSLILTENYDNSLYLNNFTGNIIILHGDSDKVIPNKFSLQLFDFLKTLNKEYVLIPGIGHNNIWGSNLFREKVSGFIQEKI